MRVLVVDDDPSSRYLLESIVRSGGHQVDSAADGQGALEVAARVRPEVVITDILMPRMDGYQLCREWKADPVLSSAPLVFYTASYTDLEDEQFAETLGADAFWRKPLDPPILLKRLQEVVGSVEAEQAAVRLPDVVPEVEILQEYNERLVHKLEEKALDLQATNEELRHAMEMLAEEISVKTRLIADLDADVAERKRVEAELRSERDFTRQVIEVPDLFICVLDRDRRIALFSAGAERITGFEAAEMIGRPFHEVLVEDARRREAMAEFNLQLQSDDSARLVVPARTKSGHSRDLDLTVSVTQGDGPFPVSTNVFGLDVTERRRTEAVETVIAGMNSAIAADSGLSDIIAHAGKTIAEAFGLALVCWALPDDHGRVDAPACAGPATGAFEGVDLSALDGTFPLVSVLTGGGSAYARAGDPSRPLNERVVGAGVAEVLAVPLAVEGRAQGAMAFLAFESDTFDKELTVLLQRLVARVAVGLALAENRERVLLQSAALESAADAIAIVDESGVIQWGNAALARLSGATLESLIGVSLSSLEADPDGSFTEAWRANGMLGGWTSETVGVRLDGSRYYEELTVSPVNGLGGIRQYVVVKRDITEARMLDQLRSSFVANVSHELRTPLTAIIGFADVLSQVPSSQIAERGPEVVRKIQHSAGRMRDLVEELLEVTTIQAEGGLGVLKRPVDLEQIVREHAEAVPRTTDHRLRVTAYADMPLVSCDPVRIGRVVENLVANAVKYSPSGGEVLVSIGIDEESAFVAVRDEGVGIAPEDVPRLFDRFSQVDMSSTREFGGVGLGLFVADEIVRAHGGTISVEGNPRKGSTFIIRLPLEGGIW
ncbi:MAG: ATP-binding protein [Coriobacteriia bacterium]